ncbi:MAG: MotA/TolQ/ExbB proton channel family protein [Deltaproteobacteria bacterium]|nr:MotA/TolQ/ExbB proton channel family protein [Deltaproteobacteria bacterium]MBN2670365.1 MotA/TolQ/ExbB proton channel family protein [Deltaproteobacteria bacterium]
MQGQTTGLIDTLLGLPIFQAEWVLWLLIGLSVVSVAIMIERAVFYRRHSVDVDGIKDKLSKLLNDGDFDGAAALLSKYDSLETNVVLFGLRSHQMGPESVEDLLAGAANREQAKYDKRLNVLATVASNAPFIGLFGTVLGIIRAFNDLAGNMSEASSSVMAGIAEALIATAVGLLVAIPAVVAFNVFKSRVKKFTENLGLLAAVLTASLKAVPGTAVSTKE